MRTHRTAFFGLTLLAIVSGLISTAARAELKTFTLDQSQSSLFITGDFGGTAFTPQGSGSLTTSYTGTIEVDLTGPTITFVGGSLIAGVNNGNWRPGVGGASGTAAANYGGQISSLLVDADAAVRNTLLDVTSAGSPMATGAFPASDLTFVFPPIATTAIDYRYTVIFSSAVGGSEALEGTYPNAATGNATLVTVGNELVLTIPVDISGTVSALDPDDIHYRLRGKLVAKVSAIDTLTWTGASAVTNGWFDSNNWDPAFRPREFHDVFFGDGGATNGPGLVNSTVSANLTVSNVFFNALAPAYHTVQVNAGATLLVWSPANTTSGQVDKFTLRPSSGTPATNAYVSFRGAGRVIVGDTNNPGTLDGMRVHLNSTNTSSTVFGPHMGTMDLSQLNTFAFALGSLKVGGSASGPGGNRGTLLLAKTNLIIVGNSTDVLTSGLLLGNGTVTAAQASESSGELQLGQANVLRVFNARIGGSRSLLGTMKFQSGLLPNPTLKLRGVDGINAAGIMSIGDNFEAPNSSTGYPTGVSTGRVDLVGGTVDCLVSNLFVGRNVKFTGSTSTRSISGDGMLTWTAGPIAVTTLNLGSQVMNNAGNATGVVNVRSNASLLAGNVSLGRDAGTGAGTGNGTLNIVYGGQVTVTNNILEDDGGANSGTSRINLTNGTLVVGGVITVDTVNVFSGVISNTGICTVSNRLMGAGTIRGPVTITANGTLAPGNSIGTLTITSNLLMSATSTNVFEVNTDTLAHDMVVGLSNVTYAGTLVISPSGGGTGFTNGAAIKLFNAASYGGSFAGITPATPGVGLVWDTSQLTVSGTLKIASAVSTTPTSLIFTLVNNALGISWPVDHTGWRLEGQTNAPGAGISTGWFTVPGSAGTNQVYMIVNPANGSVFYRLVYP